MDTKELRILEVMGPLKGLPVVDNDFNALVGKPITHLGRVIGKIEKVNVNAGTWHGHIACDLPVNTILSCEFSVSDGEMAVCDPVKTV